MKIGAQCYTIREFTKNISDIEESMRKLSDIGFKYIQVSGFGDIEPQKLAELSNKYNLEIVCTHTKSDRILHETSEVMSEHKIFHCNDIGLGSMPNKDDRSIQGYMNFINEFKDSSSKIIKNGFGFHYHNHAFEFERIGDFMPYDYLIENTNWKFILDTYWIQIAGRNPATQIRNMNGRIDFVHFKDLEVRENTARMAPIYEGNLDFDDIIKACNETNVKYALIEQDECYEINPFKALSISFNNLKKRCEI